MSDGVPMDRWKIMRHWSINDGSGARKQIDTSGLADYRACALLGAAGLGKTCELRFLSQIEANRGFDVRFKRLAFTATSAEKLQASLQSLLSGATEKTVIYLDALDEAMIPLRTIAIDLISWIEQDLKNTSARIRISCRSAVWPTDLAMAMKHTFGESFVTASLEPLTDNDVAVAAATLNVNYLDFLSAIKQSGVTVLAQQPLTLEMLLKTFQADKKLASNRGALFEKGMLLYAIERAERRELKTRTQFPPGDILEAAERLACFTLLSGRECVDLGDNPPSIALGLTELIETPGMPPLHEDLLRAVGNSGLCAPDAEGRFVFAHRQFAEYLAGRRLAKLSPHQAKTMLASGMGWEFGVAGPLRETAAFAAMHNTELANWIAEYDPEIVGLSDVADDKLRRMGMKRLLDKFRKHELAASQIFNFTDEGLRGFRSSYAEADLRRVLKERGPKSANVLQCAIKLIESFQLSSLSEELADLILDTTAPLYARKAAGYALDEIGSRDARLRLKPLIAGVPDDIDFDLKGIALRCNWPDDLTIPELLRALTPRRDDSYVGSYDHFVFELDREGFRADGHRLEGLEWARQFTRRQSDFDSLARIAKRIAHAAVDELEDGATAHSLAELLLDAWRAHAQSPLSAIGNNSLDPDKSPEAPPPLHGKLVARRTLIDSLIALSRPNEEAYLWQIGHDTPGLQSTDDFLWLLVRATDLSIPPSHRIQYANFANFLPWDQDVRSVDAWIAGYDRIPAESHLKGPLFIEIGSKEAASLRKTLADIKRLNKPRVPKKIRPAPAERVQIVLNLCETKDAKNFFGLCQELTLKDDSTHYDFNRFLSRTPGWLAADDVTRARIVQAAKHFITTDTDEPERVRPQPLNTILSGYMQAIWLLLQFDRPWIEELPVEWWRRWAWYLIREVHINLHKEPNEPKAELLRLLHAKAPTAFRGVIVELATSVGQESLNLLNPILETIDSMPDDDLDEELSSRLARNIISPDRIGAVAQFVLGRDADRALSVCVGLMDRTAAGANDDTAVRAATALLFERTSEAWDRVLAFLRDRRDLSGRVLGEFAHNERLRHRTGVSPGGLEKLTPMQIGHFISLLIENFPYESDPKHAGAHIVGPEDSARHLRSTLISGLADRNDANALLALRQLEKDHGADYPWIRDLRGRTERAYRLSQWAPIPPSSIANILEASEKRLIRSAADALEGVVAALEQYERRLHHEGHSELEGLWNTPTSTLPSPKAEEYVSDRVCSAIKDYFERYAVTADREVQVFRRIVAKKFDGEPGSEVDVLVRIPAAGSTTEQPIAIPVEVKLSNNREARMGLREQLVDRYVRQLDTDVGAFVLAWMMAPKLARKHKPVWASIDAARKDLQQQVKKITSPDGSPLAIRAFVLDAALASNAKSRSKSVKRRSSGKPKTVARLGGGRRVRVGSQKKSRSKKKKMAPDPKKRRGRKSDEK